MGQVHLVFNIPTDADSVTLYLFYSLRAHPSQYIALDLRLATWYQVPSGHPIKYIVSDGFDSDAWYLFSISHLFCITPMRLGIVSSFANSVLFSSFLSLTIASLLSRLVMILLQYSPSFHLLSKFISHHVLSLSISFRGLRSSTYLSPVDIRCTSEVVYILNSY